MSVVLQCGSLPLSSPHSPAQNLILGHLLQLSCVKVWPAQLSCECRGGREPLCARLHLSSSPSILTPERDTLPEASGEGSMESAFYYNTAQTAWGRVTLIIIIIITNIIPITDNYNDW